jgi:HlyD family secretion protein
MDKVIKKKKWTLKKISYIIGGVLLLGLIVFQIGWADKRSRLKVDVEKMTIATVNQGVFQEFIPQTGAVVPSRTFFLDAVEGGNINRVIRESGAMVRKGDPIIGLQNASLRLSVLSQENSLNEQINRVRQTRLQLDQNDLIQKQTLAQIENQLAILGPQYTRQKTLLEKDLIAKQDFERVEADYKFNIRRKEITSTSYKNDSTSRILQLKQLNSSERSMLQNLDGVNQILENLVIKAPIDGQLSTPQLQEGQNINRGQRVGQVDIVGSYKVRVPIDELYLPRISKGLGATTKFAGKSYKMKIIYIYPTITSGRFEVDMEFDGETPQGIRRGQSLRMRIELGQSSEELLLPVGGFYKDTGGNWVFVIEEGSNKAVRRNIRLGRKNTENFEVLDGLQPGDKVITSSYDHFGDNEVLIW